MKGAKANPAAEAAKLSVAVDKALHAIARLLVGRISLSHFQEMVRAAYLEETKKWLQREHPGKKVKLSRMAVVTGIDSRTITKYMSPESTSRSPGQNQDRLSDMTPETRVISWWMSEPEFRVAKSGKPKVLHLEKGQPSFARLVAAAIGGRGITALSVLKQLELSGAVDFDRKTRRVTLITANYFPFLGKNEVGMLDVGFSTMAALASTVEKNIQLKDAGDLPLFQRSTFSHQLAPEQVEIIRKDLRNFLEAAEDDGRKLLDELENQQPEAGDLTAGFSLFYFEQPTSGS